MSEKETHSGEETPPSIEPDRPAALRRSTGDKVIAGVAGGLGRYFGIDPVLVRIAFLVLLFFGGSGLLLYLLGWIAIPEEKPGDSVRGAVRSGGGDTARMVIGAVLIVAGGIWLLEQFVPRFGDFVGPLILVGLGVVVLLLGGRR